MTTINQEKTSLKQRLKRKVEDFALKMAEKSHVRMAELQFSIFSRVYQQKDSDVYVVAFPHSGSAVLRVMLHYLAGHQMPFKNVKDISPSVTEAISRMDSLEQFPAPRILNSSAGYEGFPPQMKGKVIFLVRNGMDRTAAGYLFEKNEVNDTLGWDDYLQREFIVNPVNWFVHTRGWLENPNKHPMLVIAYEDMLQNPEPTLKRIETFLQLEPTEENRRKALQSLSQDYILENRQLYDESMNPFKVYDQFIRKGKSNKGQEYFTEAQKATYRKMYDKYLGDLGLAIAPDK